MKVVFDTNIFVSALAIPSGQAEKAIIRIVEGKDQLILSKAILDELLSVLVRKFGRDADEIGRIAVFLHYLSEWIVPVERIDILKDEADNRILECAFAGKADAIVTGDKELLQLGTYRGVRLISLKDYLKGP